MSIKYQPIEFRRADDALVLLPFRFHRFGDGRVLLTNFVGEHLFLSDDEFQRFTSRSLVDESLLRVLRARHFAMAEGDSVPIELLALKTRTRYRRLPEFTGLHIFVVTLRCEHACPYCQVSRQSSNKTAFDMSWDTAARSLALAFQSPSPTLKIEFQGGEPLLNFGLVRRIVEEAEALNEAAQKDLSFVIASNLAVLTDQVLDFAADHALSFSASLDGPAELHNANRPRPGGDSWERTIRGIEAIRSRLGPHRVSALMTTTDASLSSVEDIVDSYRAAGLSEIFLRPISPYGFAVRSTKPGYGIERWLAFYERGLDYIIDLNRRGEPMVELFATIAVRKILTNDPLRYVDLMSPSGIGIGAIVYNYDGNVYASDEGRMLAEMGDTSFRLGHVADTSYRDIFTSEKLLEPLEQSFTGSAPMCSDCAFECYCGADPVYHYATAGDFLGRKAVSEFCSRNMGVFERILTRYEADPFARELFDRWAAI